MKYPEKDQRKDITSKVIKLRRESIDGRQEAITKAKEVQRYIRHEPYTDEKKAQAAEWNKPLLRYALMINKLTTIIGNEQSNRREVKFYAMDKNDDILVRILEKQFEYIAEDNDLEAVLVKHLANGLMYNTGAWMRRVIETDEMGYLTFKYQNYDTFCVHPDKEFKNLDLSDCSYIVIDEWMRLDQIKNLVKASSFEAEGVDWWEEVTSGRDIEQVKGLDNSDYKMGDRFLVCQLEERRQIACWTVLVEGDTTPYKLTEEELASLKETGKKFETLFRGFDERIFITTVVPYFEDIVVEDKPSGLPTKRFSMFYGRSFDFIDMEARNIPSLCYLMVDPQDRVNKFHSQEVDYMMQTLGTIWHVDAKDTDVIEQLKKPEPTKILPYKNINRKAIQEEGGKNAQAVNVIHNGTMTDMAFLDEVSNVTASMQGKKGNSAETGVLFESRVDQALRATNPFYEMKAKVNELLAKDYNELFPSVFFEDFRVLALPDGQNGMQNLIINQKFDGESVLDMRRTIARVVLDQGENTPNRLRDTFSENLAFVNTLISAGQPAEMIPWELIVQNSNLKDKELWSKWLIQMRRMRFDQRAETEAQQQTAMLLGNKNTQTGGM